MELEGSGCSEQVGIEVKIKTWFQIADSFVEYIQEFDFTLCKKKNILSQGVIFVPCYYQNCMNLYFFSFPNIVQFTVFCMNVDEQIIGHILYSLLCHTFRFMTLRRFEKLWL